MPTAIAILRQAETILSQIDKTGPVATISVSPTLLQPRQPRKSANTGIIQYSISLINLVSI